jgi:hypothetical protein
MSSSPTDIQSHNVTADSQIINNINNNSNSNNNNANNVKLRLVMSCEVFWKYETDVLVNRILYHPKYTNRTEKEAFESLSQFLSLHMKKHIEDQLISTGERDLLPKLEQLYSKFHIHGQTVHEILYPHDPTNSDHCRGDGKIFICTHC